MMQQTSYYIGFKHDSQMSEQTTDGNATAFSGANAITGQTSSAAATPLTSSSTDVNGVSITSGYSNPELAADSGDIIYVEERSPITRASDQTENIKLIIEF